MKKEHLDKQFYKMVLTIAIPVILQNLISIGLNMADTIMIGKLGVDELAAVGTANRLYFVFSSLCFGIYSGASVYVSQYWGVKDIKNIRRTLGIDIILGGGMALLFTAIAIFAAPQVLGLFSSEPRVIELGTEYLHIVAISYFFTSMSFAINFNCRAIHMLKVPTAINTLALVINLVFNYLLIFGKFGFSKLGVKGAALATLLARLVEFILMYLCVYLQKGHPLAAKIRELFSFDRELFTRVLKTSLPVIVSEGGWSLGNSVYYIAYGMLGASALAVVQVASTVNDLFQILFFGIGNASAVMIGNELGRRNEDKAYSYAVVFLKMTFAINLVMSVALFLSRGMVINIYDFDQETNIMLANTLAVYAIYMLPKMFTYVLFCGILRSGGDTRFCMLLDLLGVWVIGVPLAFLGVLVFHLPLHIIVAMVFFEEWVKLYFSFKRFKSKKWAHTLID